MAARLGARHAGRVLFAVALAAFAAGCGGGDGDDDDEAALAPATSEAVTTAPAAASATASSEAEEPDETTDLEETTETAGSSSETATIRQVEVQGGGPRLLGHCSGEATAGVPPIVLDSGLGGGQGQLAALERALAAQTIVCAYDRAGVGASDAPGTTPRSTTELVSDLDRFILAAELQPPVVLVGQSAGANVVYMYAQAHPAAVAGFVSMNPVPPAEPFLAAAKKVETADEFADEQTFYDGENEEAVSFRDTTTMLEAPLPATLPYAVMFDEDCGGDAEFCGRILPALTAATKALADHGEGGRFIRAKDAGHEIFAADEALVLATIQDVVNG